MMKIIFRHRLSILFFILALCIIPNSKINTANAAGVEIPYSFHNEHPYSITGIELNSEIIDLEEGGALYPNEVRADVNIYHNKASLYTKISMAGVTNVPPNDEDDFTLGNIAVGAKGTLYNGNMAVFSSGLEAIFPTSDNGLAAQAEQTYFRDFVYYVDDAYTFKPYAVLGVGKDIFALQANFGADIITNADQIEGDDTELLLEYGGTASVSPHLPVPFGTALLVEILAVSSTSFDENRTEAFLTPGLRFGGQIFSVGAGVDIPLGEDSNDYAKNVGFMLDMVIRFGS